MSPARGTRKRKASPSTQGASTASTGRTTATSAAAASEREPVAGRPRTEHRRELLHAMLRIRRFEERCVELYSAAKIRGFVHLYIGEEAVAVGVNEALTSEDAVVATYREHGHALARGIPAEAVMAEMYGKTTGCSGGRGGSMHLFDAGRRFYGGNAIVAGGLPLAAGLALADRMRGQPRVTCCFFGDGAYAEGEFHETANLAALWNLPLLLVCENNLYAMGTAIERHEAQTDLALRAASYGMAAWAVDGMDVEAVERAARRAAESIRGGGGPRFLEMRTYRFRAHSMYDPDRYRDKTEVEQWKAGDPVTRLMDRTREDGELGEKELTGIERRITEEIDAAVEAAEQAPEESVEDLLRHVTSRSTEVT
ncbi:pyruvate dehydrogenase (acetyl-transferring) E1 component subunit alpha [Streptomyces sioyaensis]|uniref:Pyruvate dehydrogenase E1 component subunit alpha n=1 Tax=Streptomyces sioyaensis TaxID=67364 RepID=A0A4Q1RCG4_9ACTN|nr:pyruvate dehydrogenase (acetyl-transferring) E1 component subunit alpha [Streptomyces sioyaensis]MBM4796689.1 pyruvate dehydrogenase (acetyl-transferring) E1 component subunit alpha [Streptomyces sioyaensis]RXS71562.1 pyruvate dehydrogenase (acetyl-transferring) E1 component subunit alpha [Streptomyces sioyaensis]